MVQKEAVKKTKASRQKADLTTITFPFIFEEELESLNSIAKAITTGKKLNWKELFDKSTPPDNEVQKNKQKPNGADQPPALLFLQGENGIGKTTVLECFAQSLECTTLYLTCYETWTHPLHILKELIEQLVAKSKSFNNILNHYNWGISGIHSDYGQVDDKSPCDKSTSFFALCSALVEFAKQQPLVIIFDDVDLSDSVIIDFLGFLGRSLSQKYSAVQPEPKSCYENSEAETTFMPHSLVVASCKKQEKINCPTQESIVELQNEPFSASLYLPKLSRKHFQVMLSQTPWRKLSQNTTKQLLEICENNTLLTKFLILNIHQHKPNLKETDLVKEAEIIKKNGIIHSFLKELSPPSRRILSLLSLLRYPISKEFMEYFSDLKISTSPKYFDDTNLNYLIKHNNHNSYFVANSTIAAETQQLLSPSMQSQWHDTIADTIRKKNGFSSVKSKQEIEHAFFQHAIRGNSPERSLDSGLKAANFLEDQFAYQKSLVILYNLLGILTPGSKSADHRLQIMKKIIRLEEKIGRPKAAKQNIKSLLADSATLKLSENDRAELILDLSLIYKEEGRFSKALKTLGKAFSKKLGDAILSKLLCAIASVRLTKGDSKRALNYCLRGLSHTSKNKKLSIRVQLLSQLSKIYKVRNDYALAVDTLLKALDAVQHSEIPKASLPILDQLGQLYLEQGNYFRAARYLYRSLETKRNSHDLPGLAESYTALGEVYLRSGNYAKAIEQQQKAAEIREMLGNWEGLSKNLIDLGTTFPKLGKIKESIGCLRRSISISEKKGQTNDIVAAFMSLSEIFYFIGDINQSEEFIRQVKILSQEYNLRIYEARVAQLEGQLLIIKRQWDKATKQLKKAGDIYSNLGEQMSAIEVKLDLANLLYDRELYSEAFKVVAKAQVNAEEVRSSFLQAKALLIKGKTYRFLKGASSGKWRECLEKALNIAKSVADLNLHFEILYSLGKAYHDTQSFSSAEEWYRKAEDILKRISGNLTEEEASKFWVDKRRQLFREDYQRFRRESGEHTTSMLSGKSLNVNNNNSFMNSSVFQDLLAKISRLNSSFTHENFFQQVLGLAMNLVKADRGFLVETINTNWQYTAFLGLKQETLAGRLNYAETMISELYKTRKAFTTSAKEEEEKYGNRFNLSSFKDRIAILIPVIYKKKILGALYLDKTEKGENDNLPAKQTILEQFTKHVALAWHNRRTFLSATTWEKTPFLVEPYFAQVVSKTIEQEKRGGKPFALLGIRLPYTLKDIDEQKAKNIQYILERERSIGILGESILVVLLTYETTPKDLDKLTQQFILRLKKIIPIKKHKLLKPDASVKNPAELFKAMKDELYPSEDLIEEINSLSGCDLGLKDAKQLLEKHLIMKALRRARGNITRAAKSLNVHRPQLSQLLKKHELKRELFSEDSKHTQ